MKTRQDPRHLKRQKVVEELFSLQFHTQNVSSTTSSVMNNKNKIDSFIQKAAPEFPVEKINRVDLAILRLGVFELNYEKKEPANVVIDEAVELAKEYGNESSPAFVNGVLGKIITYGSTKT